jgi:hypothetical protein
VYPNPSAGIFHLIYTSDQEVGNAIETRILDDIGRVVYEGLLNCNGHMGQLSVDLGQCPRGVYFIITTSRSDRMVRKLIIN